MLEFCSRLKFGGPNLLGLPCAASYLWDQKIDAEGCVLVLEETLEFGDLFTEHIRGIAL